MRVPPATPPANASAAGHAPSTPPDGYGVQLILMGVRTGTSADGKAEIDRITMKLNGYAVLDSDVTVAKGKIKDGKLVSYDFREFNPADPSQVKPISKFMNQLVYSAGDLKNLSQNGDPAMMGDMEKAYAWLEQAKEGSYLIAVLPEGQKPKLVLHQGDLATDPVGVENFVKESESFFKRMSKTTQFEMPAVAK